MPDEHPKFRGDLIVRRHERPDGTSYVIKDPITRRFFRFKLAEYRIAEQLDGRTPLPAVQKRIKDELGSVYPLEQIERFIERLHALGLTDRALADRDIRKLQSREGARRNRFGRLLYIRLKAIDPDRFFDAVIPHIGFVFTRGFVLTVSLLVIAGVAVTVSNWSEYVEQVKRLFHLGSIPTFVFVVLLMTGLHEMAHGLSCKHFGGRVHEMGFILIYFLPAFYCNVSDAWLFDDKRRRLWVSFAGVFFQLFVWSLAAILWRILDTQIWLSEACCLTMATSGLTALFNFNPLIKLDGYYLLSDYLDIPNLRGEAFSFLRGRIGEALRPRAQGRRGVEPRERRVFLWYGVTAGFYSAGLLVFVFLKIAQFIASRIHGVGVAVLVAVGLLAFVHSADGTADQAPGSSVERDRGDARRVRRMRLWIGLAAIVLVLVFGVWELRITGDFNLLPGSRASVRAEVDGTIRKICVGEGDLVMPGDTIVLLDETAYRAEKGKVEAEIAEKGAELAMLRTGPTSEAVTRLRKLIERERIKVEYAEKELKRLNDLYSKKLVTAAEYERGQEDVNVLRKQLEQAQSDLAVLLAENRPEMIQAAESELKCLQTSSEFLSWQLGKTVVQSPISGIILTHRFRDRITEHLAVGDEICQIGDCARMLLEIGIPEKDVAEVRAGQRVKLKARSLPSVAFYGAVVSIAPIAVDTGKRTVVIVTSEVDNPRLLLRPGMTGKAKIYCGKRRLITLLTRNIVRFIRVEFWF